MLGRTEEVELVPGGSEIPVTNRNKLQYIYTVADLHLNRSIKRQCAAFRAGLSELVPHRLLTMFSEPELQTLISGSSKGVDVADLRAHSRYAGGFTGASSTIRAFWKVVEGLDEDSQRALLRFVTSCERAPPLGFADMQPSFTIQRVPGSDDRLPTASTCFNTLKLSPYSSAKVLRKQLLTAIHSGTGFNLS